MSEKPDMVANAASEKQVRSAKQKELDRRDNELADVKSVLGIPGGRRLLWRLLEHCKVFETIWIHNAQIHYNAGKQDVGHMIMKEITDADENAFIQLMVENKERSK